MKKFAVVLSGCGVFDGAEIRIHPTGSAIVRTGTRHQGQGHETTWAQIVSEELGLEVSAAHGGELLEEIKELEAKGFAYEAAEASVALLMARRQPDARGRVFAIHDAEIGLEPSAQILEPPAHRGPPGPPHNIAEIQKFHARGLWRTRVKSKRFRYRS